MPKKAKTKQKPKSSTTTLTVFPSESPSRGCTDQDKLCCFCNLGFPTKLEEAFINPKNSRNLNILIHMIAEGLASVDKKAIQVRDVFSFADSHFEQLKVRHLLPNKLNGFYLLIKNYLSAYSGWVFLRVDKRYTQRGIISVYDTDLSFYKRIVREPPEPCNTDSEAEFTPSETENATTSSSSKTENLDDLETQTMEQLEKELQFVQLDDLEFPKKEKTLGVGGYGKVQSCSFGRHKVAVKSIITHPDESAKKRKEREKSLLKEAALTSSARSKNVVNVFGVSEDKKSIIFEYANLGDLCSYISHNQLALLKEWPLLISIFTDICYGLRSLHTAKPPIIHRDLKLQNILLKKENKRIIAMITDLGISKLVFGTVQTVYDIRAYLAPEVRKGEGYGLSADIYSMGVIGVLLFYPGWTPNVNEECVLLLPPLCDGETKERVDFFSVISQCLDLNPEMRPDATQLYEKVSVINKESHNKVWKPISLPT